MNRLSELDTSLTPAYQNNYMQPGVTRSAKSEIRKWFCVNLSFPSLSQESSGGMWVGVLGAAGLQPHSLPGV